MCFNNIQLVYIEMLRSVSKELLMLSSHDQVRELYGVYAENASQRMNIYLRAFIAADEYTKMELISQAKPLVETGAKLLQSIKILQVNYQTFL